MDLTIVVITGSLSYSNLGLSCVSAGTYVAFSFNGNFSVFTIEMTVDFRGSEFDPVELQGFSIREEIQSITNSDDLPGC